MTEKLHSVDRLPIYVLSVKSFKERQESILRQTKTFKLNVEFVFDFDADDLTAEDLGRFDGGLTITAKSCALKHFEAQRRLVETGHPVALVLEDDALLFENFLIRLERVLKNSQYLQDGWLISLGGADDKVTIEDSGVPTESLIEKQVSTTEAYLIDSVSARLRLDWLKSNQITRAADHQIKSIDEVLGIAQFRVAQPLCTQGSVTGHFESALDRSRQKHSRRYLMIRYKLRRLFNQHVPRLFFALKSKFRR
jgi:glycosyl transferase, family 25